MTEYTKSDEEALRKAVRDALEENPGSISEISLPADLRARVDAVMADRTVDPELAEHVEEIDELMARMKRRVAERALIQREQEAELEEEESEEFGEPIAASGDSDEYVYIQAARRAVEDARRALVEETDETDAAVEPSAETYVIRDRDPVDWAEVWKTGRSGLFERATSESYFAKPRTEDRARAQAEFESQVREYRSRMGLGRDEIRR